MTVFVSVAAPTMSNVYMVKSSSS